MWLFSNIGKWFKSLFNKIGAVIEEMWALAKPFLRETLSKTAQNVWASTQNLFIEAALYVKEKGLPTDDAKRDAFKAYMILKANDQVSQLKDLEFNLLREMAVAIAKKLSESR